jgi:hypothetical protein
MFEALIKKLEDTNLMPSLQSSVGCQAAVFASERQLRNYHHG